MPGTDLGHSQVMSAHKGSVICLTAHGDGVTVASGDRMPILQTWDGEEGTRIPPPLDSPLDCEIKCGLRTLCTGNFIAFALYFAVCTAPRPVLAYTWAMLLL